MKPLILAACCAALLCANPAFGQKDITKIAQQTLRASAQHAVPKLPGMSSVSAEKGLAREVFFSAYFPHTPQGAQRLKLIKDNAKKLIAQQIRLPRKTAAFTEEETKIRKMAAFDAHAMEMVVNVQNPYQLGFSPFATAFFVEETYQGKKYLWGVTAQHVANALAPDMHAYITFPEAMTVRYPVKVVARGNAGMADVALFEVPEGLRPFIRPIRLAPHNPKPNDNLRSYGFFSDDLFIVRNRRVLQVTPSRIITSFEFGNLNRSGACGGPLLNEANQVVGIHCGSSRLEQESYSVPVSFLKDLMAAAHHNGVHTRALRLNGKTIGKINVDEYIDTIRVLRGEQELDFRQFWHKEVLLDYNHLENAVSLDGATRVEILLIKGGTPHLGDEEKDLTRSLLSVDLQTGQTTQTPL